ncbi:MAG: RDD family protein [Bacteroidales bacterium]|nr:RDD family protein [Bacteroidales bacterium]
MSYIKITSSQNVKIHFKLASLGERVLAGIIDLVIAAAYLYVAFKIEDTLNIANRFDDHWSKNAVYVIISLPVLLQTLVLENLFDGQTFGKKVMKIKVIKEDGYGVSFLDLLMRWILRIVDVWVFFSLPIIGIISISTSSKSQRIGDKASGTVVISLKDKKQYSQELFKEKEDTTKVTYLSSVYLSDNDIRIIKETFENAKVKQDYATIKKLREKIEQVTKTTKGNKNDYDYINTVLQDYYTITKEM